MTYATGSTILAADYNAFVSAANNIDEVFADLHSNATTVAAGADFGYGRTSPTDVSIGQVITAAQWSTLFNNIRNTGTHQGTSTATLPANPVVGGPIIAYSAIPTLLTTLRTNRFLLPGGEQAFTTFTAPTTGSAPWTNTLTYTFSINMGNWNQARYFMNSGGQIGFAATYPAGTGDDAVWNNLLNEVGQIFLRAKDSFAGGSRPNSISTGGFWGLTGNPLPVDPSPYFEVFRVVYGGGGVYTNSSLSVRVRLAGTPPAVNAGTVQFQVILTQTDSVPPLDTKAQVTTFFLIEVHSAGALPFLSGLGGPGPAAVSLTPGSYVLT
ncbi:MAG: hypothetical protein ACHQ1D_01750 [Nitrososphaerales archaeon]